MAIEPVKFVKGENIHNLRPKLNMLAQQAAAVGAAPGMFVGAGLSLQRLIGSSEHFQIVRGTTLTAVTPIMPAFQITGVAAYEENSSVPTSPLWIAAPAGGVTLGAGVAVWAIYKYNVLIIPATISPPAPELIVDWLLFTVPSSGAADPPLRRFIYKAHKLTTDATATVQWLDHTGVPVGPDVVIYDPAKQFYGRLQGYLFSGLEDFAAERAFEGLALLRTDLAEEDPEEPRYDIIASEGFKSWIKVQLKGVSTYPTPGQEVKAFWLNEDNASEEWGWEYRAPANPFSATPEVGYEDDLQIFDPGLEPPYEADGEVDGPQALMQLCDPNTIPPTYRVLEVSAEAGKRIVRGLVNSPIDPVAPAAPSFFGDNLVGLAGGVNPSLGDPDANITVMNVYGEGWVDNQSFEAAWNKNTSQWEAMSRKGSGGGGAVRFVRLMGIIDGATYTGPGEITPAVVEKPELIADDTTGATSIGATVSFLWYGKEFTVVSGRERVGILHPLSVNPELLVLVDPDCGTFGEDD